MLLVSNSSHSTVEVASKLCYLYVIHIWNTWYIFGVSKTLKERKRKRKKEIL